MADTVRKKALDSLKNHLKGEAWVVSGGVGINPGKTLYKKAEMPGISIFVGDEQGGPNKYGVQNHIVPIELKYVNLHDSDIATVFDSAEDVRGQMIQSAMTATFGGLATKKEYTGGSIYYPDEDGESYQVSITITIEYETKWRDPYTSTVTETHLGAGALETSGELTGGTS